MRGFWPEWATALARVEHNREPYVFAVAEREDGAWWCGASRAETLAAFVTEQSPLRQLACVNVPQIKIDIDTRAAKARIDLRSGNYILPPDHPTLVEWLAEFRARRDAAQRKFDPLRAKAPPRPTAAQRRVIEGLTHA